VRKAIDAAFSGDLSRTIGGGYWYDWGFAQILLGEAQTVMGQPQASSSSPDHGSP